MAQKRYAEPLKMIMSVQEICLMFQLTAAGGRVGLLEISRASRLEQLFRPRRAGSRTKRCELGLPNDASYCKNVPWVGAM